MLLLAFVDWRVATKALVIFMQEERRNPTLIKITFLDVFAKLVAVGPSHGLMPSYDFCNSTRCEVACAVRPQALEDRVQSSRFVGAHCATDQEGFNQRQD